MKLKPISTIIALAINALVAYGFYSLCKSENQWLLCIGSFVTLSATLIPAMGFDFSESRSMANVKVLAYVFFLLMLISNLIFAFVEFSTPSYVVINGVITLIFIFVAYSIGKTKV